MCSTVVEGYVSICGSELKAAAHTIAHRLSVTEGVVWMRENEGMLAVINVTYSLSAA